MFYIEKMCNGLEVPLYTTDYHVILGKLTVDNMSYLLFTEDYALKTTFGWLGKGYEKYFLGFETKKEAEDFCLKHNIDLEHTLATWGDERTNYQIVEESC